ncbi:MAG: FMN-dependent NADH-azoreductase 2 [bacterium ADurb.Bin363]|nr:MAG: FMN-dependent NADH-azoreductase 2 [bacterium ADurb.Bin363]
MAKVLYIKASPREERSYSHNMAKVFLKAYNEAHPDDTVETLDLWKTDLPAFDLTASSAKYKIMGGLPHSEEEKVIWEKIVKTIDHFKSADKYILSSPMWNFEIPYRLKQYLDIIIQPGFTFSYDPETGYSGLVTGKPVQFILARGGEYPEGTPAAAFDHQTPILKGLFAFMGFTDMSAILIEPTLMAGPEVAKEKVASLHEKTKARAKSF